MADFRYHPSQSLNPYYLSPPPPPHSYTLSSAYNSYYPSPPQSCTLVSTYNTHHQLPFHYYHLLPPAAGPPSPMACLSSSQPVNYYSQQYQHQHPQYIHQHNNYELQRLSTWKNEDKNKVHQVFDKIPEDEVLQQFNEDEQICEIIETDGFTMASSSTVVENIEKLTDSEVDRHEDLRKLKVFIDEDAVEDSNDPTRMLVNALVESENKSSEELKKRTREQNCGKKQMAEEEAKEKEETQEKEEEVSTITFSETKDEESPEITFSAVSDSVENNGTANLPEDENLTPPGINATALIHKEDKTISGELDTLDDEKNEDDEIDTENWVYSKDEVEATKDCEETAHDGISFDQRKQQLSIILDYEAKSEEYHKAEDKGSIWNSLTYPILMQSDDYSVNKIEEAAKLEHVSMEVKHVVAAVGERFYKVTAEALRVCGELVRVVRPSTEAMVFDFKPFVHPIYNAIMSRLTNQDQDQEVKECAITCMGLVISTFGDQLRAELPLCLPVLVDRMGNEITRLTAVKAFAVIATSPLHIDLSCVLDHLIAELTGFLRKANRVLRQATLVTMNTVVTAYGDKIGSDDYEVILVEFSPLISVSDLHMTALALELCCTLMIRKSCSENISLAVRNKVLPQALTLVKSPLLQGQALLDLQKFFEALVYHANTSFYTLLESLLSCAKPSPQSGGVPKQALYSIAQCVAVLCLAAGDQNCWSTVKMLVEILKDDSGTNSKNHLALLSLGEIGRRKDLSAHAGIETIVIESFIESFQSPFEEIKSAASYALGNIAVGNLSNYLPFILDQIDNQQKKQYILLHSLKEVIVRQSVDKADFQNSSVEKILALLFNHCESEEEGVRNVVAECLGKMALIEPEKLVPARQVRTTSPAAFTRATVVTAVKYSVVERPEKLDEIIFPEISSFLMLIKDGDRHVRRAAVSALSTFAHYKPNLIKGLLPQMLPLLYDQTIIKKELIRTVDLGPFKHVVDDGLELRKAAFECVFTLFDSCLDQVNPSSLIVPFLKSRLEDHYDLKMLCHLTLSLLAEKCPSAVLAVLDSLVEPLQKTINFKPMQMKASDINADLIINF